MASFDLQTFINKPGIEQIKKCRKDDLIAIANHFQIPIPKQSLKREIKSIVVSQLLELKILATPGSAPVVLPTRSLSIRWGSRTRCRRRP